MKNLFLFLLIIVLQFSSIAQTEEQNVSKSDIFSKRSGTLIHKEFVNVGALRGVKMEVVHYTDLITDETVSALRFSMDVTGKYTSSTVIASLDSDEIEALISSIKILRSFLDSVPTNYTEVTFTSRSGFSFGCYYGTNNVWKIYMKLDKHNRDSYAFMNKDDIQSFLDLILESQKLMK